VEDRGREEDSVLQEMVGEMSDFPFKHFVDGDCFSKGLLNLLAREFPPYSLVKKIGVTHSRVNEHGKAELNGPGIEWPGAFGKLVMNMKSRAFCHMLSRKLGIDNLIWDDNMHGGGIHCMRPGGALSVHADFNREGELFRRANVIVYLNDYWQSSWGGELELWNDTVTKCCEVVRPSLGRTVFFETIKTGFHGVAEVKCPYDITRNSFSAFYYTKEPPPNWDGTSHSTIFRYRPNEKFKQYVRVPAEKAVIKLGRGLRKVGRYVGI